MTNGLVNRVRLEATGHTHEDVNMILNVGVGEVKRTFGGTWLEDEEHPRQVQNTANGAWGYVWLKRLVMS